MRGFSKCTCSWEVHNTALGTLWFRSRVEPSCTAKHAEQEAVDK